MTLPRIILGVLFGAILAGAFGFFLLPEPWPIGLAAFGALWGGIGLGAGIYRPRALSLLGLALDVTWSLPNTLTGIVWLVICAARGRGQLVSVDTQRSGTLVITGAAAPGADATTLGNVIGGKWAAHEETHVWQARLFGPLYWPLYLASYLANLAVRVVTLRFTNLHWRAYGRVVLEDWAYWSDPNFATDVDWGGWFLGFLLALLNLACLLLLLRLVPVGGLPVAPWLLGLAGLLLYALIRSFPAGHSDA